MRLLLILGIAVLVVFVVVLLIAPGGAPLDLEEQQAVASDFDTNGAPSWLKSLGDLVPSPPIRIESPPAVCPGGTTHFAAAGEGWRVLRMALKSGAVALVVVSLLDPRRDHKSGPYRICLGSPDPFGCSNERIGPRASVPVGPHGGCIAAPPQVAFN